MYEKLDKIRQKIDDVIDRLFSFFNSYVINLLMIFILSGGCGLAFFYLSKSVLISILSFIVSVLLLYSTNYNEINDGFILDNLPDKTKPETQTLFGYIRAIILIPLFYITFFAIMFSFEKFHGLGFIFFSVVVTIVFIIPILIAIFKFIVFLTKPPIDIQEISLKLMLAIVKSENNEVSEIKLKQLKKVIKKTLKEDETVDFVFYLNLPDSEFNIDTLCKQINEIKTERKVKLLYQLFSVATSDKVLTENENKLLDEISRNLRIPKKTYNAVKTMFAGKYHHPEDEHHYTIFFKPDNTYAYNILGISKDASETEIKHAYRTLAKQCHPDKFATLGEQMFSQANEQFSRIENAYELIKKERRMK